MKSGTAVVLGMVLGGLALGGARFLFVDLAEATHYHANWALFVDGERVDLTADRFMEDVSACSADPAQIRPQDRVHMHENNHDVVHVHHPGATWGHFLANLGYALGEDFLVTPDDRILVDDSTATLKFVLNGVPQAPVHNRIIRSEDRLLISYGPGSVEEARETQYPRVADNAAEYNRRSDPASCLGHGEPGFWEKLRAAFWE